MMMCKVCFGHENVNLKFIEISNMLHKNWKICCMITHPLCFNKWLILGGVSDPDPGSGEFLSPVSGMKLVRIPDLGSGIRNKRIKVSKWSGSNYLK
jgi:hypothetical protein